MSKIAPKKPPKVGIREEIRPTAPGVPKRHLFLALLDYTGGCTYLRALRSPNPTIADWIAA